MREERVAPAPLPLLPPVSSQRLHKTRVNGSAITSSTPFSKRPPAERARDREKEGVGERERERRDIEGETRPVYKWSVSLSLSLSVSRLSRNVVLARLGSRQSKFSQIPRKSFLPRGADALFALLPRIGGREGRGGGISPMGYTGFFVSINSLHPDMRGL